ncbi:hypothetical protein HU200_066285 [Digitaria exilis]|uniref:Uncharacterized protein n=1 Tax=Digitaria exilis TaxID=1010633 RepID=A0A834ZX98_9POAL|nr:hypothetical protein HU200_066285 [Digitaria exilis]
MALWWESTRSPTRCLPIGTNNDFVVWAVFLLLLLGSTDSLTVLPPR